MKDIRLEPRPEILLEAAQVLLNREHNIIRSTLSPEGGYRISALKGIICELKAEMDEEAQNKDDKTQLAIIHAEKLIALLKEV